MKKFQEMAFLAIMQLLVNLLSGVALIYISKLL